MRKLSAGTLTATPAMLARAFEAYVNDRLHAQSRNNLHLVANIQETDQNPYPQEKEKQELNQLFTAFFISLKKPDNLTEEKAA